MKKILLMYMPVIHAGYIELIRKLTPDIVLIISDEIADRYDKRRKDIRALHSSEILATARVLFPKLEFNEFNGLNLPQEGEIHMPIEDISENILSDYLLGRKVVWESVFLRYDSKKSKEPEEIIADRTVSRRDPAIAVILAQLNDDAMKSPDWWRQVSTCVEKDGKILSLCRNIHVPSDAVTGILGDPRSNSQKGLEMNITKAAHSEPRALFEAGKENCVGANLYTKTFPCPYCGNLIYFSGIKSLYFVEGYSVANIAEDLRSAGIELVRIVD